MEQQLAAMSHEMQSMRQYMAQEQQGHAQEIQRLQDRITMSKPNNWVTRTSSFSAATGRSGTSSPPSSAVRLRLEMEVWPR